MAVDFISPLRRAFDFKLEPMQLPDGGLAFVRFCQFASGESPEAKSFQSAWAQAVGKTRWSAHASSEEIASYIDWLIRTQWSEEPKAANDPEGEPTHA